MAMIQFYVAACTLATWAVGGLWPVVFAQPPFAWQAQSHRTFEWAAIRGE